MRIALWFGVSVLMAASAAAQITVTVPGLVHGYIGNTFCYAPVNGPLTCPTQMRATASGGTAPYTFAVTAGALPPGITLNAANGLLAGVPTTMGNFPFTIRATDSLNQTGTGQFVITVDPAPFICNLVACPNNGVTSLTKGVPWSFFLQACPGSVWTGLPPGITQDPATQRLTGIPQSEGNYIAVHTCAGTATISYASAIIVGPPVFLVAPASLSFSGVANGPTASMLVSVGLGIQGQTFSATTSGGTWLSALAAGPSPGTILVMVNPAGLAAGRFTGAVNVTAPGANPALISIPVTYDVGAGTPVQLTAAPARLTFEGVKGSTAMTQVVAVGNAGSGNATVTAVAAGGTWLTVSPGSGAASSTNPLSLVITANPATLNAGTFSGRIIVSSATSQVEVPVTLSVTDPGPKILVSETGFFFSGVAGLGPLPSKKLTIANTGSGTLNFTATASTTDLGDWLTVSPGSAAAIAGGTDADLQVVVDPRLLSPGVYYGRVNVAAASAQNSPGSVSVVLNVAAAGTTATDPRYGLTATPAALVFTSSGSQSIVLSTAGEATLYAVLTDDYGGGPSFFTHSPANGNVTFASPLTVTVQVSTAGLNPGIYRGSLVVQSSSGPVMRLPVVLAVPTGAARGAAATCVPTQLVPVVTTVPQSFSVSVGWPTEIEVLVLDDCATLTGAGAVRVNFSNSDPPISLSLLGDGRWSATWASANSTANVVVTVTATTPDRTVSGIAKFGGAVAANPLPPPLISDGGVVNGASFALGGALAPGSFITLFGSKLAQGQLSAPTVPLPRTLAGAKILIGSREASLFFSSDGQLNAIIPYGIPPNTSQSVVAQRELALSPSQTVSIAAAAPGIFAYGDARGIIVGPDGRTLVDANHPVTAGQVIVAYCTGLGEVDPPVTAGNATPANLYRTVNPVTLTIGGVAAKVDYAGLTPNSTGLYQVNAVVPQGVALGDRVAVVITEAGQVSSPVFISVR